MKKQTHSLPARILSMLLALVCILGLLPGAALAASPDSIVMEDCTITVSTMSRQPSTPAGSTR